MSWRNITLPRESNVSEWEARYGKGRIYTGKLAVDQAVNKWTLLVPLLIAPPHSDNFHSVLAIDEYKERATRGVVSQYRFVLMFLASLMLFSILISILFARSAGVHAVPLMVTVILVFMLVDYRLVIRQPNCLAERVEFFTWLNIYCRADLAFWVSLMLLIGAGQLLLLTQYPDMEAMLMRWGIAFEAVRSGEWWRLLAGPYFHASISHWTANAVMLALFGTLASGLSRASALVLFLLGSLVGSIAAVVVNVFWPTGAGGYLGVSPGIYALIGLVVGISIREPRRVPSYLALTLSAFAVIIATGAWLTSSNVSNAAHLTGFAFGLISGTVYPKWRSR